MTFFSRLALAVSLVITTIFLSGCGLFHWGSGGNKTAESNIWPTVGNHGTNPPVARFIVGDIVTVTLQGPPENEIPPHIEPIKDDGTISMPEIGRVAAVGKTPGELQNDIHDLYVPKYYNQLTVTVSVGDRYYYVNGEVKAPGRQFYLGETTVTKALTTAGDFTDYANRHDIWLIRGNRKLKVDFYHIFDHPEDDPLVYPNDTVRVTRRYY